MLLPRTMVNTVSVTFLVLIYTYCVDIGVNSSNVVISEACNGNLGQLNACTRHSLACDNSSIAIHSINLQNKQNIYCKSGVADCRTARYEECCRKNASGTNIPLNESTTLITRSIYRNCSHRGQCEYRHGYPINATASFSEIEYACVEEERILDLCSTEKVELRNITIVYNSTTTRHKSCSCTISRNRGELSSVVHALDIRLGDEANCSELYLQSGKDASRYNCSSRFYPYNELQHIASSLSFRIQVKASPGYTFVWIAINGPFTLDIRCSPTKEKENPEVTDDLSKTHQLTPVANTDVPPASSNTGAVVGGVMAAVLVVAVIVVVIVCVVRKRKSRETHSEKVDDQRQMKQWAKSDAICSLAGNDNLQKHQYNEICLGSSMKKGHIDGDPVREYTYAVVNKPKKPTEKNGGFNVYSNDYEMAGNVGNKQISQDVEDTYDHTPSTGNVNFQAGRTTTDTYDTALASSGSAYNTKTHSESNYNHISLANAEKEFVLSNDYDTTTTTLKYGQDESDYDHTHRNGDVVGDSEYDTADNV